MFIVISRIINLTRKSNFKICRYQSSDSGAKNKSERKPSKVRFKFHKEIEDGINCQINKEFGAGYLYLQLSSVFNRDTEALPGFHRMFLTMAKEEVEHAMTFINYQSMRGGQLELYQLSAPKDGKWTPESAVDAAIEAEKNVTDSINQLIEIGTKHNDNAFVDFLTSKYMEHQYEDIKTLGDLSTKIKTVGPGVGIYLIDKELLETYSKEDSDTDYDSESDFDK